MTDEPTTQIHLLHSGDFDYFFFRRSIYRGDAMNLAITNPDLAFQMMKEGFPRMGPLDLEEMRSTDEAFARKMNADLWTAEDIKQSKPELFDQFLVERGE